MSESRSYDETLSFAGPGGDDWEGKIRVWVKTYAMEVGDVYIGLDATTAGVYTIEATDGEEDDWMRTVLSISEAKRLRTMLDTAIDAAEDANRVTP